jgi:hypothetical protein
VWMRREHFLTWLLGPRTGLPHPAHEFGRIFTLPATTPEETVVVVATDNGIVVLRPESPEATEPRFTSTGKRQAKPDPIAYVADGDLYLAYTWGDRTTAHHKIEIARLDGSGGRDKLKTVASIKCPPGVTSLMAYELEEGWRLLAITRDGGARLRL